MSTYDLSNRIAEALSRLIGQYDPSITSAAFIDSSAPAKQAVDLAVVGMRIKLLGLFDPPDRINLLPDTMFMPSGLRQSTATVRGLIKWLAYKRSEAPLPVRPNQPAEPKILVPRPPVYRSLWTEVYLYGHRWSTGRTDFNLGSLATEAKIATRLELPLGTFNGSPEDVQATVDNLNELHQCVICHCPFEAETVEGGHNLLDDLAEYRRFAERSLKLLKPNSSGHSPRAT